MPSICTVIFVALGGDLGSVSLHLLATWSQTFNRSVDFLYGTLAVNLIACFLVGFLSQLAHSRGAVTSESKRLVFVGVLGGLTTFSAFGSDTMNPPRAGQTFDALANVGANVLLGLLLFWPGRTTAMWISGARVS